jgi:rod shape determining protein RodA
VAYGLGLCVAGVLCLVNYQGLARWSLVLYWLSIVLLLLVLLFGSSVLGAKRWINFGFFKFQPSEFAKLACLLTLANYLSRPQDELRLPGVFIKTLGLSFLPFVLILKEPDLGSALVLAPITLVMMFVAGVPRSYLVKLLTGVGLLVALILVDVLFAPSHWQVVKLRPYQQERLLVFFGLHKHENIQQALISVGSGGFTGKGWCQGTQNALGYLPRAVSYNDFIFSVIAEEEGFLGSATVIALYTVILFSGIKIASQARDRLGRVLAAGVVTMIFSHVFINIGMNIRLMPVTGIPLPLLSYGGTSVLCFLIAAGILQNIHTYRRFY